VLTLIDTQFLITGVPQQAKKGALAVIVDIAGHQYGLLVDKVEDVIPVAGEQFENNIRPSHEWERLVSRTASVNDRLVMILDTSALVGGQTAMAA
jgi:purine-binding chemotaxis protein CheW